jgi:hypothetical protein
MLLCLTGSVGQVLGCSSKDIRYPEDHARYQRVDAAVQAFRKAYVAKDLSHIQSMMLPTLSLDRLERDISSDFQSFQEISLDISIERIVIEGDSIDVYIHWQGQWKRSRADVGMRERGHGVLRWVGIQSILLTGTEGDLPFGMGNRQPVPAPERGAAQG